MKNALLDTDTLSFLLRGNENALAELEVHRAEGAKLYLSRLSFYEITSGLEYKKATRQLNDFYALISDFEVIETNEEATLIAAEIYGDLRRRGFTVDDIDILNAGIALAHDLKVVTNNEKHYRPIENLIVENWVVLK